MGMDDDEATLAGKVMDQSLVNYNKINRHTHRVDVEKCLGRAHVVRGGIYISEIKLLLKKHNGNRAAPAA